MKSASLFDTGARPEFIIIGEWGESSCMYLMFIRPCIIVIVEE